MAALIHLDTHVVVWLYSGRTDLFPDRARDAIRRQPLRISPMVMMELRYLEEIGRVTEDPRAVVEALEEDLGLAICDAPFSRVARRALDQSWTRDPFDRIIVSQAALQDLPLVTRDRTIRDHYPAALWD